jgi:hypothetical protein
MARRPTGKRGEPYPSPSNAAPSYAQRRPEPHPTSREQWLFLSSRRTPSSPVTARCFAFTWPICSSSTSGSSNSAAPSPRTWVPSPVPQRLQQEEHQVFERMFNEMWVLLCSFTDMWVPLMVLNEPHYESAHITSIKQKIRAASFLLPNVERSHSILKIWNRAILLFQIPEPNAT